MPVIQTTRSTPGQCAGHSDSEIDGLTGNESVDVETVEETDELETVDEMDDVTDDEASCRPLTGSDEKRPLTIGGVALPLRAKRLLAVATASFSPPSMPPSLPALCQSTVRGGMPTLRDWGRSPRTLGEATPPLERARKLFITSSCRRSEVVSDGDLEKTSMLAGGGPSGAAEHGGALAGRLVAMPSPQLPETAGASRFVVAKGSLDRKSVV